MPRVVLTNEADADLWEILLYIARDNEDREPGWESAVLRIDIAPITDAQCDDAAQKQSFVGDRIENDSKRTPLIVATRDVSIQSVADCRD